MDGDCRFDGKVAAILLKQYHDGEYLNDTALKMLKISLEFLVGFNLESKMTPLMAYYNTDLIAIDQMILARKKK